MAELNDIFFKKYQQYADALAKTYDTRTSREMKNAIRKCSPWVGILGIVVESLGLFSTFPGYKPILEIAGLLILAGVFIAFTIISKHFYEQKAKVIPELLSTYKELLKDSRNLTNGQEQKINVLYESFEYIHLPVHNIRDLTQSPFLGAVLNNVEEQDKLYGACVTNILDMSAALFNKITGHRIVVGVMFVDRKDPDFLVTSYHSNTAPTERVTRRKEKPTRIPTHMGIAGQAFTEMRTQIVNDISALPTGKFVDCWEDDGIPIPKSVISCPFKVNGIPAGVLNIDSQEPNIFESEKLKYLAQALADFLAHILQLLRFMEGHRSWS